MQPGVAHGGDEHLRESAIFSGHLIFQNSSSTPPWITDFIAFWTARSIGRRLTGLDLDFDLSDLGTVWYFAETPDGNLLHYRNKGLPWDAFSPQWNSKNSAP